MKAFESPITGLSQIDFEFAVDYIAAVEFGRQDAYAVANEAAERGINVNDLIDDHGGRLNEILHRLDIPYETFRAICWNAIINAALGMNEKD